VDIWSLPRESEFHGAEQNKAAACSQQTMSVTGHLTFSSDHVIFAFMLVFLFTYEHHDDTSNRSTRNTDMMVNNGMNNLVICVLCGQ